MIREGCRLEVLTAKGPAAPRGLPALVDALVERTRAAAGAAVQRRNLLVALLAPGEELLL